MLIYWNDIILIVNYIYIYIYEYGVFHPLHFSSITRIIRYPEIKRICRVFVSVRVYYYYTNENCNRLVISFSPHDGEVCVRIIRVQISPDRCRSVRNSTWRSRPSRLQRDVWNSSWARWRPNATCTATAFWICDRRANTVRSPKFRRTSTSVPKTENATLDDIKCTRRFSLLFVDSIVTGDGRSHTITKEATHQITVWPRVRGGGKEICL